MVRGIPLDAFGTLIDTGRGVLLKVSRAALEDHGRGVAPDAFLEVWDRHFFGANPPELLQRPEGTRLASDALITSGATRRYKPRPAIFEAALQALGMPAQDIVHVGDSLTADVAGAGRRGVRAVWRNRSGG